MIFKSTLIAVLIGLSSFLAFAKGNSGGGGDILGSDPESAQLILEKYLVFVAPRAISEVTNRLEGKSLFSIDNERIKKIYRDILKLKELEPNKEQIHFADLTQFFKFIDKYNQTNNRVRIIPTNGFCRDPWGNRKASHYIKGTHNPIKICMSIPLLKQLPEETLVKEFINLVVHEMAHAAGYGERDAVAAQKYYRKMIDTPCVFKANIRSNIPDPRFESVEFDYGSSSEMAQSLFDVRVHLLVNGQRITTHYQNYMKDVSGNIDIENISDFTFKYSDFDGKVRTGAMKFSPTIVNTHKVHQVNDSYVVIQGKKLEFTDVDIIKGCK